MSRRLGSYLLFAAGLASTLALPGCAMQADSPDQLQNEFFDDGDGSSDSSDPSYIGSTTLQYEGSCDFLSQCSVYSSASAVHWGCGGTGCDMTERWVAVPDWRTHMCGEIVTLCHGDVCTTAKVKDVSCCGRWEASHAVLADLGIAHDSNSSSCSGYGQGRVSIYSGDRTGGGTSAGGSNGGSSGYYCAQPGYACDGNEPCWAECPEGTTCDYAHGTWGSCQ